jgi:CBS domain-containing protein
MTGGRPAVGKRPKPAAAHPPPAWLKPMPVRDWMRQPVTTVSFETSVGQVAELMRARQVRHLPVLDRDGRLIGIVTDRDLRQVVFAPAIQERLPEAAELVAAVPLAEVMTWHVVAVQPGTDLRQAARLMHERKIGALPVVEQERVVGILTETDVLRAFREMLGSTVATVDPLEGDGGIRAPYDYGFTPPGGGDPWQDASAPD